MTYSFYAINESTAQRSFGQKMKYWVWPVYKNIYKYFYQKYEFAGIYYKLKTAGFLETAIETCGNLKLIVENRQSYRIISYFPRFIWILQVSTCPFCWLLSLISSEGSLFSHAWKLLFQSSISGFSIVFVNTFLFWKILISAIYSIVKWNQQV